MSNSAVSPPANRAHHGPTPYSLIWSVAGVIIGMITGYVAGAAIGGIWVTRFSIGNLDGAEATGVLTAVVCGIAVGILSFQLALRHKAAAVAWGFIGVIVGAITGFIVGANIAGNWMTEFSIGNLHGAEATGMLGGVVGGIAVGVVSFWLTLRHRSRHSAAR